MGLWDRASIATLWADLRWWWRARRVPHLDGTRQGLAPEASITMGRKHEMKSGERIFVGGIDRTVASVEDVHRLTIAALIVEIVHPRWWDLRRWIAWLRCPHRVESVRLEPGGRLRYVVSRAREAKAPRTHVLERSREEVEATLARLRDAANDPGLRSVPDDELESRGIVVRDEDQEWWR